MMLMYLYAVQRLKIGTITHKFLIKGHTQNEGDSVHSVIEKSVTRALKSGPIYVPSQFITLIQNAKRKGKPYQVTEMSFDDFFDIKDLSDQFVNINSRQTESFKINEVKIMRVTKDNPGTIFYKNSYAEEQYKELIVKTKRTAQNLTSFQFCPVYKGPLPLSENKKSALLELLKAKHIKKFYADFYNSICSV